jgi:ATP-binding protein involved in chromosome partitioning
LKTWLILHQKSYLTISITFWQRRSKKLSRRFRVPFLEEYLLYNPYAKLEITVVLQQTASAVENILMKLLVMLCTRNGNENLPASEAVKITTMAGCSAVKKIRK